MATMLAAGKCDKCVQLISFMCVCTCTGTGAMKILAHVI